MLIIFYKLLNW